MHTSKFQDEAREDWTIHHNGDWSGDIFLHVKAPDGPANFVIPAELAVFIVGEMVRQFRTTRLEEADSYSLVTLPSRDTPDKRRFR